jgi:hypothetical protein
MIISPVFGMTKRLLPLLALVLIAACSGGPAKPDQIILGKGWYDMERSGSGDNWWVWTKDQGEIIVKSGNDATLTLRGGVGSMQRPNKVDVSVNGKKVAEWEIAGDIYEQRPFKPLSVSLVAGKNTIEFKSQGKGVKIPTDVRELAIAVDNLTLTYSDGRVAYEIRKQE